MEFSDFKKATPLPVQLLPKERSFFFSFIPSLENHPGSEEVCEKKI